MGRTRSQGGGNHVVETMTEPTFHHRADELASEAGFVRRLALSLVHDEHEAEDLAQDAAVAALTSPDRGP